MALENFVEIRPVTTSDASCASDVAVRMLKEPQEVILAGCTDMVGVTYEQGAAAAAVGAEFHH